MKKDWRKLLRLLTKYYNILCNLSIAESLYYKAAAMKFILFATLQLLLLNVYPQSNELRGEFATNRNGLMYSEADMKNLRFTVDSLNLRFKTCDLNKKFFAWKQTKAKSVSFISKTNDLKKIIAEISSAPSFEALIKKYASLINRTDTQLLVILSGTDKEGRNEYLQGSPIDGYYRLYIDDNQQPENNKLLRGWIFDYTKKDEFFTSYTLECHYFAENWQSPALPEGYGKLIQYVDCMIDTSATVFLTSKFSEGGWFTETDKPTYHNLSAVSAYIDTKRGVNNSGVIKKKLTEADMVYAENELAADEKFKALLCETIDSFAKNESFDHQLETLAEKLQLYDKALLMKRCYRIMGGCSQDTRPREHARDIAILAAKAHSWDIFLRAHLDIMNDRFDRVSDGSYAYGGRMTYLKELEELNLNIVDLMLGLTLRAENTADNHYYGSISRLGRAMAESKERNKFEEKAITMMKDNSLDEFNQGLIFLLYHTYTNYLPEKEGKEKREILHQSIASFPDFIQASIIELKEPAKNKRRR
jgi:hypothetical protein